MKSATLERLERYLVVATVLTTSVLFWRGIRDSFDLTKASLLWFQAPLLLLLHSVRSIHEHRKMHRGDWLVLVLIALLGFSVIVAPRPWFSVFGQPHRFTGLLTLLSCVFVYIVVARSVGLNRTVDRVMALIAVPTVLYTLIQSSGYDPFEWSITSFGQPIFSTVGNPNTASGFISCLLPFLVLARERASSRSVRSLFDFLGGCLAGTVGLLLSFQGQVVVVVVAAAMVVRSLMKMFTATGTPAPHVLFEVLKAGLIGLGPFLATRSWHCLLLGGLSLVVGLASQYEFALTSIGRKVALSARPAVVRSTFFGFAAVALALVVVGRGWIESQLASSLVERGDFYRAAWRLFLDRPLFGGGLENFGFQFTEFRAEGHALRLENSRTSSAHSIPLAFLSSGGVLLGLVVLFIAVAVVFCGYRNLKSDPESPSAYWYLVAWIALLVQTSVSVEHVSIFLLLAVVAGLIVSDFRRTTTGAPKSSTRRSLGVGSSVGLVVAFVLWVLSLWPLSAPIRANYTSLEATKSLYVKSNIPRGVSQYEDVVRLARWDFQYLHEFGLVLNELGDRERAADLTVKAAGMSNFNPVLSLDAAIVAASVGRVDDVRRVLMAAAEKDPYAIEYRAQATDLMTQVGEALRNNGNVDLAREFAANALQLDPAYGPALDLVARLG